jgi:hypothetical protein
VGRSVLGVPDWYCSRKCTRRSPRNTLTASPTGFKTENLLVLFYKPKGRDRSAARPGELRTWQREQRLCDDDERAMHRPRQEGGREKRQAGSRSEGPITRPGSSRRAGSTHQQHVRGGAIVELGDANDDTQGRSVRPPAPHDPAKLGGRTAAGSGTPSPSSTGNLGAPGA